MVPGHGDPRQESVNHYNYVGLWVDGYREVWKIVIDDAAGWHDGRHYCQNC